MSPAASPPRDVQPTRLWVAVAEDDDAFRSLLCGVFERAGYRVTELEDGFELCDFGAVCAGAGEQPAVVLTDLRMPGMSGLEAVRAARAGGLTAPVVVLTAFPDDAVYEAVALLGDATVLGKPVDLDRLCRVIERVALHGPSAQPLHDGSS